MKLDVWFYIETYLAGFNFNLAIFSENVVRKVDSYGYKTILYT
jgi:hypothetical protein